MTTSKVTFSLSSDSKNALFECNKDDAMWVQTGDKIRISYDDELTVYTVSEKGFDMSLAGAGLTPYFYVSKDPSK
ncbi:hypothetical protein [Pseudomonas fluorescens]|uniref:hypothetical protein n=1 Tax=Pseudomonas fluorescens TaxID=294 RepID=UPI001CA65BAC|nr:hypothetical protein [Pseudomonas fluorescens]MBY8936911.1 hypothetical protein [Pseudomonas fluorescens]